MNTLMVREDKVMIKHKTIPKEILETIEKIEKIIDQKYNALIMLNEPFRTEVAGTRVISKNYCFKEENNIIMLDMDIFNKLPKRDQIKELKAIILSTAALANGLTEEIDKVKKIAFQASALLFKISPDTISELLSEKEKVEDG